MTCEKIKNLIKQGAKLIDVRTVAEYMGGRLTDSSNVPLDAFGDIENTLDKDQPVLLYCRSGARSGMAAQYLQQLGYDATNIGGISQYPACIEY